MHLIEVTTAAALVGLLTTGGLAFGRAALGLLRIQEAERQSWQTGVLATDMFVREWRAAGYSAAGASLTGIGNPRPDGVELYADLDGDGSLSGYHERIGYRWDATRTAVLRSTQGASPQPWLDNVPPGGFQLRYVDDRGARLDDPTGDVHRIAGVEVRVTVEWKAPLPQPLTEGHRTLHRFVARRNR